jgi:general secretion pathway protein M
VAIGYSVLWAPAADGRARLRANLPAMQRQLALMTAQADEARSLAARRRASRRADRRSRTR